MKGSLRAFWLSVKASYWFLPTILTIAAFLLSLLTVYADRSGGSEWLSYLPWYEPSRPDGARAQLTVIASAMIAIASTVFAITIAAVAYASGNYGPRLLTNFMNDRGNQVSLGIFIATFVYNLMILRVVRDPQQIPTDEATAAAFVPQVSVLVSVLTMLVAVAVLVYFLHHVPASIRINSVLGGIGRRLLADIEKRFPDRENGEEPAAPPSGERVKGHGTGYIEIIDFERLDKLAEEAGVVAALKVRTGDFIHPHLPVVEVSGGAVNDELAERIHDCFSLGNSRTPTQDLEFLIDELVEIALRALSPGINDPFTAITSLHWIGAAMASLSTRDLCRGPEQADYDPRRVRPIADDFGHYMRRSFGNVRQSAAANAVAAKTFLETVQGVVVAASSSPQRRATAVQEMEMLLKQAESSLAGPAIDEIRWCFDEIMAESALPSA